MNTPKENLAAIECNGIACLNDCHLSNKKYSNNNACISLSSAEEVARNIENGNLPYRIYCADQCTTTNISTYQYNNLHRLYQNTSHPEKQVNLTLNPHINNIPSTSLVQNHISGSSDGGVTSTGIRNGQQGVNYVPPLGIFFMSEPCLYKNLHVSEKSNLHPNNTEGHLGKLSQNQPHKEVLSMASKASPESSLRNGNDIERSNPIGIQEYSKSAYESQPSHIQPLLAANTPATTHSTNCSHKAFQAKPLHPHTVLYYTSSSSASLSQSYPASPHLCSKSQTHLYQINPVEAEEKFQKHSSSSWLKILPNSLDPYVQEQRSTSSLTLNRFKFPIDSSDEELLGDAAITDYFKDTEAKEPKIVGRVDTFDYGGNTAGYDGEAFCNTKKQGSHCIPKNEQHSRSSIHWFLTKRGWMGKILSRKDKKGSSNRILEKPTQHNYAEYYQENEQPQHENLLASKLGRILDEEESKKGEILARLENKDAGLSTTEDSKNHISKRDKLTKKRPEKALQKEQTVELNSFNGSLLHREENIIKNIDSTNLKCSSTITERHLDPLGPISFAMPPLHGIQTPRVEIQIPATNQIISQNLSKRKVHQITWNFKNDQKHGKFPAALKFVEDENIRDGKSIKREIECHLYIYQKLKMAGRKLEELWPSAELLGYFLDRQNPGRCVLITRKLSGPDFFDVIRSEYEQAYSPQTIALQRRYEMEKLLWCTIALQRVLQYGQLGIRHNDIKPDNIVIDVFAKDANSVAANAFSPSSSCCGVDVKIIDLGTASMEDAKEFTGGTSWYESPEQKKLEYFTKKIKNYERARLVEIDAKSDWWGAGLAIAEVLLGRRVVDSMKSAQGLGPLEYLGDDSMWVVEPSTWIEAVKISMGLDDERHKFPVCAAAARYIFESLVQPEPDDRLNLLTVIEKMQQIIREFQLTSNFDYKKYI